MLHAPRDVQLHALYHGTGGGGFQHFFRRFPPFFVFRFGFPIFVWKQAGVFPGNGRLHRPPL